MKGIPKEIRDIFGEWGQDFEASAKKLRPIDKALADHAQEMAGFYYSFTMANDTAEIFMAPDVLKGLRTSAMLNAVSPIADLKKEAEIVLKWLDSL
jgi:hypothetical protein